MADTSTKYSSSNFLTVTTQLPAYMSFSFGNLVSETFGVAAPEIKAVGDINNDGFDDIIIDYYETGIQPLILLGSSSGELQQLNYSAEDAARRHIRNGELADVNNDGYLDFIGFTTGDPGSQWVNEIGTDYGKDIPRGEADLLLINQNGSNFTTLKIPEIEINDWNHGGTTGDIDGDGWVDILPLREGEQEWTSPRQNIAGVTFNVTSSEYSSDISYYLTPDGDAADLNRDGHLDLVVATWNQNDRSPTGNNSIGTIRVVYGDGDFDFTDNLESSFGEIWMSEAQASEARKIWENYSGMSVVNSDQLPQNSLVTGPSNVEILDIDADGWLDIVQGQFFTLSGLWISAGFKYYKNTGDGFIDATDAFFPNQEANRNYNSPLHDTDNFVGYIHNFSFADLNSDGLEDLILSSDGGYRLSSNTEITNNPYLFINDGDGTYLPISIAAAEELIDVSQLMSGDFNGEGKVDLVGIHPNRHHDGYDLEARVFLQAPTVSGYVRDRMGVIMQDVTILIDGEVVVKNAKDGSYEINVNDPALTELFHFEYSDGLSSRSITSADALEALRISVGLPTETGEADAYQLIAADVNQDGRVTSADALEILKHSVGIETTADFEWEFFDTAQTNRSRSDLLENLEFDLLTHSITIDTEIDLTGILLGDVNDTSGLELRAQSRIVEVRSGVIDIGNQANVPAPFASEAYDIYKEAHPTLTPYWWHAVRGMPHVTHKTDEGYVVLKSAMFQYHDSSEISPLVIVIDEGKNIVSANGVNTVDIESAFAFAEATVGGVSGKIVAESGPELADRPFTEWPYGNLWFSHLDETGSLSLTPLLDVRSQFADVGVGDINLDGLDDIVAVHLGTYDSDWRSLRLYTQNDDGSFSKDSDFFKFLDAPAGVVDNHWVDHSVTVADLNGDGFLEIIEGTYNSLMEDGQPLFQIHSTYGDGVYHLAISQPREGPHATLGLTDAQAADLDSDGDLDLVFKTEGAGTNAFGNGFILYRNDGDFLFTDVTDEWSGHSLYNGPDFGISKLHLVDLDGDGTLDIFTEHFGEVPNSDWSSKNLGALIHLNDGTGHLEWQGDNPDFTVPGHSLKDGICSHFLAAEQGIVDIMMIYPDQTIGVLTADLNYL